MEYYGHNDYRDYLSHHGILGMKWGKRNGPPYPLGPGDHSVSEKKAGWRDSLKKKQQNKKVERQQKDYYDDLQRHYRAKDYRINPPKVTLYLENSKAGKRYKEAIKADLREADSLWNDEKKRNEVANELEKERPSDGYYKNIEGIDAEYAVSTRLQRKYGDKKINQEYREAQIEWEGYKEKAAEDILGEYANKYLTRIEKDEWSNKKQKVTWLAKYAVIPDQWYMYDRAVEEYEAERNK